MAHQTNFVVQALFKLNMVCKLENLIQTLYAHFRNSPKRHLELSMLVKIIETYGNKLLKMSKQGGFLYWNLQRSWWVNTTPHFNGQDGFGLYLQQFCQGEFWAPIGLAVSLLPLFEKWTTWWSWPKLKMYLLLTMW